ncbi:MAG: sugar nucleotide-binding protein [Proteobacteria bacterium]|nr:sugar nucleotide-binding protein [Pseudomonadota bacterium]
MKFLVTGGEGMLGRAFAQLTPQLAGSTVFAPGKHVLDVRDEAAMLATVPHAEGGWVVHCAAMVNVEGCARDPDTAREIIVGGTRNAIALARTAGARLLYPQSFLVHDGRENPIPENAKPCPLSLYGELKYECQRLIEDAFDDALIITMAGFFGGEEKDKNFVGRIIPAMHAAILRGETRFIIGDRVWQPTWTDDLAFNALHLMLKGCTGHYQMACHGEASFAELAAEIVIALGWRDRLTIDPVDAASVSANELGRRPDRAVLSCERLKAERLDLQRDWRSTLHAYLLHPFFNQYRFS